MMSMPNEGTAWAMEPQRKMRAVVLYTFCSGVSVGGAVSAIHEHRRKFIAYGLCVATLLAYHAWSRWKKIGMP
jgi:hypothetical protein